MSAQNSKGIQTLLDAEREAQKIVQKGIYPQPQTYPLKSTTDVPQPENVHTPFTHLHPSSLLTNPPNTDRSKRVKDAKNEAQKEIEEYRKQKDDEFKEFERKQTSGNKKAEEDASKDADEQLKGIKEAGGKKGDQVVEDLLRVVTDVKPEVPDRVNAPPK